MCSAHAQVISAAELSIGIRVSGLTRTTVREALWVDEEPRPDVRATRHRPSPRRRRSPDVDQRALSRARAAEFAEGVQLTPEQLDRVVKSIDDALGDRELTIDELGEEVVARTGAWAGERVMPAFQDLWPRWRQAIRTAAHRGAFASAPTGDRR